VKIAVFAPIPRARVKTAASENPKFLQHARAEMKIPDESLHDEVIIGRSA
jgi:hypothetical protein